MVTTLQINVIPFLFCLCCWVGCKKDPITPPDRVRTPHDYTWTRDTLGDGTFQSSHEMIWGSSASDVYMVASSSEFGQWEIWHFDGIRWTDITSIYFETFPGPPWYRYSPIDVTGFGPNDVWIVGLADTMEQPAPLRTVFALHKKPNGSWEGFRIPGALNLYAVGGVSSTDLWVGGLFGQMFHYDGAQWQEHRLSDSTQILFIKAQGSNKVVASGWEFPGGIEVVKYFEWNGIAWSKIEERNGATFGPEAGISFEWLNGKIISTNGPHISERVSPGVWKSVFYNASSNLIIVSNSGGQAFASGRMTDGSETIYYYDGTQWGRIAGLNAPNSSIYEGWSTPTETFLIGMEDQPQGTMFPKTYVIRGK